MLPKATLGLCVSSTVCNQGLGYFSVSVYADYSDYANFAQYADNADYAEQNIP